MTILSVLLSVTAYSAVVFAAILLFRLAFKKHVSPAMLYIVWFLLIARLMMPVTVDSGFSLITIPAKDTVQVQTVTDTSNTGSGAVPEVHIEGDGLPAEAAGTGSYERPAVPQDTAADGFILDLPAALIAVWIFGMLLMLSQAVAASIKLKKRLLGSPAPVPDEWLDIAEKIKAEFNIRSGVRIMMVKDLASPALVVSAYPSILMPGQPGEDIEKIEFALRHEMMHLKRKDHIVCLLLVILRIIYWFNPVVWFASKQIKIDMETACDSAAVQTLNREEKKRYAGTVLDMYASEKVRFALGMSLGGTRKTAERRIRGIFMRKRSSYKAKIAVAALAAVMLFACFTTACQPVQGEPAPGVSNTPAETAVSPTPGAGEPVQSSEPTATPAESPTVGPTATPTATPEPSEEPGPTQEPVAALPSGVAKEKSFTEDIDEDGTDETIVVGSAKKGEEIHLYVLYTGGYKNIVVDKYESMFKSAYLTRTGSGDICLLVSVDEASEDYLTYTYSFSGLKPVPRGEADGYASKVSGTQVTLCGHRDAIGTWDYTCKHRLGNDFTLERTSDYTIVLNGMQPLHTIRELPVEMLVDGTYTAGTLPAGTVLTPAMTDWNSYMTFKLEDGSTGRFYFTPGEDYEAYIDGIVESEYFDNIAYSD